jgi:hypothetical protein
MIIHPAYDTEVSCHGSNAPTDSNPSPT